MSGVGGGCPANLTHSFTSTSLPPEPPQVVPSYVQEALGRLYNHPPGKLNLAVVTTGAGGHLGAWMLSTPGASNVLQELTTPYSRGALQDYLGHVPSDSAYCSPDTALALAKAAFSRSVYLSLKGSMNSEGYGTASLEPLAKGRFVGVGCTASVVTSVPKKGEHRAHVCTYTEGGARIVQYSTHLVKGARDRPAEDHVVSKLTLTGMLEASELEPPGYWITQLPTLGGSGITSVSWEDQVKTQESIIHSETSVDCFDALHEGQTDRVLFVPRDASPTMNAYPDIRFPFPVIIYSGSFNPLHEGHIHLAVVAQRRLQAELGTDQSEGPVIPAIFEISSWNADKGHLPNDVLKARVTQFNQADTQFPVVLTRTPLFVEKARLFPNCYFLIGADTAKRILDVKYYGHSVQNMVLALSDMLTLGCKFIVGGRVKDSSFVTLEDILMGVDVPDRIKGMFIGLSEDEFRMDISSTEIRARLANKKATSSS